MRAHQDVGVQPLKALAKLAEGDIEVFLRACAHPVLVTGPLARASLAERTDPSATPLEEGEVVSLKARSSGTPLMYLGRALSCDVILPYKSVSRIHAQLAIDEQGDYRIADNGSRYGTHVNGVELAPGRFAVLRDGDQVVLGEVQARFFMPESLYYHLRF